VAKNFTTEEFIIKAKLIHGDKYDYSKVKYFDSHTKIQIKCITHNYIFEQTPTNHLSGGCGCSKCNKNQLKSTDEYIQEAKKIHGEQYDYNKVNYINSSTKVIIICPIHGEFLQSPAAHLRGQGCQKCASIKRLNYFSSNTEEFIKNSKEIHGVKYDYLLVNYKGIFNNVKIICPEHGIFNQTPNSHINKKSGCPKCSGKNKTTEDIIKEFKIIHGEKYNYSLVIYEKNNKNIRIICNKCQTIFNQQPSNHLSGNGCPKCKESKGEKIITKYLLEHNLNFVNQKIFKNCTDVSYLKFDFYLGVFNTCIEYDGEQHFNPVGHWGGEEALIANKRRDKIKTQYCLDNDIKLIRIPYTEYDNIEEILNKELNISQN